MTIRQRINRGATRVGIVIGIITGICCLVGWGNEVKIYNQPAAILTAEQNNIFLGNLYVPAPNVKFKIYNDWPHLVRMPFYKNATSEEQQAYALKFYELIYKPSQEYPWESSFFNQAKVKGTIKVNYTYLTKEILWVVFYGFLGFLIPFAIIKIITLTGIWVVSGFMKE